MTKTLIMSNVFQVPTVQKIKFFENFYCLGFDEAKVENAEQDMTKMADIDKSKDWNPRLVACDIKYYKELNTSENEIREINKENGFAQELN
jgi:hypothetical protein